MTLGLWLDPPAARPTGPPLDDLMDLGRALEANGFEWLWLSDPIADGIDHGDGDFGAEPFTLAGALAAVTRRLGLGVVPAGSRVPSMLAKLTTSLDVISHGRAALGVRLVETKEGEGMVRANEALRVCRSMFFEENPTFAGRFYRIESAINRPGPVRSGGIPAVAFATGTIALSGDAAVAFLHLLDAVVVEGDELTTANAVRDLEAARSVGGGRSAKRLIWASPPFDTTTGMAQIVEEARRQRAVGATGVLVRMAGLATPATVAEIAARLTEPVGKTPRDPATA